MTEDPARPRPAPGEPDAPRLGELRGQQYSARQIARVGRDALPAVLADRARDAGKVYCPCCHLRESRWRRHFEADGTLRLFVYCTQCHKTGVRVLSAEEVARGGPRGCAGAAGWALVAALLAGAVAVARLV